jgi:hypothetical protein
MMAAAKPNSKIKGVQIGTITYSFRSMPDQSAEATLKYCLDSGIGAVELMGEPLNNYIRKQGKWDSSPAAAAAAAANAGRGARGGFPMGGGRGPEQTYPLVEGMKTGLGNNQPAGQWNGKTCPAGRGGGPGGMPGAPAGLARRAGRRPRGARGERGAVRVEAVAAAAANRRRNRRPRRTPSASGAWRCR